MTFLFNAIITISLTLVSAYGVYNYAPLSVLETGQKVDKILGATITTIAGSDTLTSSRTVINTNFSNLNDNKFELSDWYATTSATQITTLGTITSGTWTGGVIGGAYGGTASSTLSVNQVLLGNGSSGIKVVSGWGTSGQLLTSGGLNQPPTWTSATFDVAANYSLSGTWTHSATSTFNSGVDIDADVDSPLILRGISYTAPSVQGASSTALMTDATGGLSWITPEWQQLASTTLTSAQGTSTLSGIPYRQHLMLLVYVASTSQASGREPRLRFNGDGTANYSYRVTENAVVVDSTASGATGINLQSQDTNTDSMYYRVDIHNVAGGVSSFGKRVFWSGVSATSSASIPTIVQGAGFWSNVVDAITQIDLVSNDTVNTTLSPGTHMVLYGSKE